MRIQEFSAVFDGSPFLKGLWLLWFLEGNQRQILPDRLKARIVEVFPRTSLGYVAWSDALFAADGTRELTM